MGLAKLSEYEIYRTSGETGEKGKGSFEAAVR